MPTAQKIITSLLFFTALLFIASPVTAADFEDISSSNYKAPQNANYTMQNLEHTLLCELAGQSPIDKCLGTKQDGKEKKIVLLNSPSGGAIGGLSSVVAVLYTRPTSTVQYLASIGNKLGLGTPVYAADTTSVSGSGASIIAPIKDLWQVIRNISYLAFILIFLLVGFMIMFRQKINPQTVITAQAAIPGLIVGLLLVTFSYFIASLIIDLSFIGIPLVTRVVVQTGQNNVFGQEDKLQELAKGSNVLQLFGTTAARFPDSAGDIWSSVWDTANFNSQGSYLAIGGIFGTIIGGIIGTFIAPGVGTIAGGIIGAGSGVAVGAPILTGLISLVVPLILVIGLFIQMFRLLFSLIGTYIQLLIATITGPIVILASSIPGRGGGITSWLKTLAANALVFPAVFAAFLFAGMILAMDPSLWRASPPLFGGFSTRLLQTLLAYGLIMATPAIPDAVRGLFGIRPQQGGLAGAALAGFGAGAGGVGFATRQGYGGLMRATGLATAKEGMERQNVTTAGEAAAGWGSIKQRALRWLPKP